MRLKVGGDVRLFNGQDGEWRCTLTTFSKRGVELEAFEQTRTQAQPPDLWLCAAPIKKAHFEYMIEKATELGVAVIQPILTARTQIREVNVERCHSIAIEAAEQSERLDVPTIRPALTLKQLTTALPPGHQPIICAESGAAEAVGQTFARITSPTKAAIITGPEGGFTDDEFDFLRTIPHALFIRLGPRILRADTAAIAALGCWQALCGDWKTGN
jgi:16S rRNA (uracil1498-N3)-methyltransferase